MLIIPHFQHKSLLQKVEGWKDADITKFLTSLHHLRKTIKNSDDHLLKVFQKQLQQSHHIKMPDEEELKNSRNCASVVR